MPPREESFGLWGMTSGFGSGAEAFYNRLADRGHRAGFAVHESALVPEGQLFRIFGDLVAAPLTYWSLQHEGRWPMLSRYSRGMIELERDRRQRKKEMR